MRVLIYVLVVVGAVILALSALADVIGLGKQVGEFGWQQLLGTIVGAAVLALGILLKLLRKPAA